MWDIHTYANIQWNIISHTKMKLCQSQQQGWGPRGCQTKLNKSDRERQTSHEITHMWNLKTDKNELVYNTEIDSHT